MSTFGDTKPVFDCPCCDAAVYANLRPRICNVCYAWVACTFPLTFVERVDLAPGYVVARRQVVGVLRERSSMGERRVASAEVAGSTPAVRSEGTEGDAQGAGETPNLAGGGSSPSSPADRKEQAEAMLQEMFARLKETPCFICETDRVVFVDEDLDTLCATCRELGARMSPFPWDAVKLNALRNLRRPRTPE